MPYSHFPVEYISQPPSRPYDELFPLRLLSQSRIVANLSLHYRYFYGKYCNELHSFVLPHNFTMNNLHPTYTGRFFLINFSEQTLEMMLPLWIQSYLLQVYDVHRYLSYISRKLHFLPPLLTLNQHRILVYLYLEWLFVLAFTTSKKTLRVYISDFIEKSIHFFIDN